MGLLQDFGSAQRSWNGAGPALGGVLVRIPFSHSLPSFPEHDVQGTVTHVHGKFMLQRWKSHVFSEPSSLVMYPEEPWSPARVCHQQWVMIPVGPFQFRGLCESLQYSSQPRANLTPHQHQIMLMQFAPTGSDPKQGKSELKPALCRLLVPVTRVTPMHELVHYPGFIQLSTNITKSVLCHFCLQGSAFWHLGARWIIMQHFSSLEKRHETWIVSGFPWCLSKQKFKLSQQFLKSPFR